MTRPAEKVYDLSVRVEGDDGKPNWYSAGIIHEVPPDTIDTRDTADQGPIRQGTAEFLGQLRGKITASRDRDRGA